MKRIGMEIRFDNSYQTAKTQIELLKKKPTKERIDNIRQLLKDLDKCINKIEQEFYGNSKINKKDAENKVADYKSQRKSIKNQLQNIELALQQKELCQRSLTQELSSEDKLKLANREMAEKQLEQVKNARKMLIETKTITKDTVAEMHNQVETVNRIHEDVEEADVELTMINEFMSIISNRNLLTKLILLALVVFLGAADIIIIILKIS